MITPTRFGLKYAPVPTLALEYEDDVGGVEEPGSAASLFVLREGEPRRRVKKLHVVELPMLSRASEPRAIAEQLQRDNSRFLAPSIVNENQLKRLLGLLIEHLQAVQPAPAIDATTLVANPTGGKAPNGVDIEGDREEGVDGEAQEESFIEESMAESSQALESSEAPSEPPSARSAETLPSVAPAVSARGTFLSQEESESEEEQEKEAEQSRTSDQDDQGNTDGEQYENPDKATTAEPPAASEKAKPEAAAKSDEDDDDEKKKALKSESEVSEEDIQSEELEYFSEDGSDEDSF